MYSGVKTKGTEFNTIEMFTYVYIEILFRLLKLQRVKVQLSIKHHWQIDIVSHACIRIKLNKQTRINSFTR